MLIGLGILLGILVYIFCGRITYILNRKHSFISHCECYDCRGKDWDCCSLLISFFWFVTPIMGMCILPIKLADFVTNPANYKFRIKFERKGE